MRTINKMDIQCYEDFVWYMDQLPFGEMLAIEGDFRSNGEMLHSYLQRMNSYRACLHRNHNRLYLGKIVEGKYSGRVYKENHHLQYCLHFKKCNQHFYICKFPHEYSEEFLQYEVYRHPRPIKEDVESSHSSVMELCETHSM